MTLGSCNATSSDIVTVNKMQLKNKVKVLTFANKIDKESGNSPIAMMRNIKNGRDKKLL